MEDTISFQTVSNDDLGIKEEELNVSQADVNDNDNAKDKEHFVNVERIKKEEDDERIKSEDEDREPEDESLEEMHQLSEYELRRLENIKRNEEMFKELKLHEAKEMMRDSFGGKTTKSSTPSQRGLKRQKIPKSPPPPRRASLRIRRLDPLGTPLPDLPVPEEPRPEHPRKPSGPLDIISKNDIEESVCKTALQQWFQLSSQANRKTIKFEDQGADMKSYTKKVMSLKVEEDHALKAVPDRIFSVAMHPMESRLLAFAGDKWGKLGIWDVDSKEGHDGVFLFEPHSRPINCMDFCPSDCNKLYTCSYDGTMRCMDLEKQVFHEVFTTPEDDDLLLNAFSWAAGSSSTMLVANGDGYVSLIDSRTCKEEKNLHVHNKSTRCVHFHPVDSNLFVTSSRDGSVSTWDLRKFHNIKSSLSTVNASRVATSVYFSPHSGNKILITSMDDFIRVYDVNPGGQLSSSASCSIRHCNQTGRWLTKFRAVWDPKTDNCFVIGSMARPRCVDIYTSDGRGTVVAKLQHDNLTSITSLNTFHPTMNVLIGGNSSGRLFLWK